MDSDFSLLASFEEVDDPRLDRTKNYPLNEILLLVLTAVICGVKSWCGVEEFGNDRLDWLRKYYPYMNGIPSHDTIGRVFSLVKPKSIIKAYAQFMSTLFHKPEDELIALDGKTLRRSFDKASGQKPLHILNAWAVKSGVSLAQLLVDKKTNEMMAVPELLDMIDIRRATITVDALNTQKKIAAKIVENGADYVMPVKNNHKNLKEEIEREFDTKPVNVNDSHVYLEETEKGHGRIETRRYSIHNNENVESSEWIGLCAIGKVESYIERGERTTSECRYYILSFHNISRFKEAVRGHWGVENQLHWVLDVTFGEDDCRVRTDHAPENFSLIRKLALNLLRAEESKSSIPMKQARASRRTDFLDKIMECGAN